MAAPPHAVPLISADTGVYACFPLGFAVSARARQALDFDALLAETAGQGDAAAARRLAARMRGVDASLPIYASEIATLGVLWDILRFVVDHYCLDEQPGALTRGVYTVGARRGWHVPEASVGAFVENFPPEELVRGLRSAADFLASSAGRQAGRDVAAREMILLSLAQDNPAMAAYRLLFDDTDLKRAAPYVTLVNGLEEFMQAQPPLAALGKTLFNVLRAPMLAHPNSLDGQLQYILMHWAAILPEALRRRLLLARGLLAEEHAKRGHVVAASPEALTFGRQSAAVYGYPEYERFSYDRDWMSNVVLMAKSVYVWLDQLSRQYQRALTRLDQIPDQELDRMARWGFSGLWLIGVWERSPASEKIKRAMGNPEAVSSAYSLYDYVVAHDLGGEEGYANLRDRAAARGIRLASDMVPNHVGIYSRWVVEHPDWFLQCGHAPFPNYRFTGPNLSLDPGVSLHIEDGYWDRSDAAVVFARVDHRSGGTRYIYHGNDGTHMPWNDTAQLNYLLPEVREAVIQTILHVARLFPIIRFDAAMTLAKKHYQRLWFPLPGEGGAIPTRAEHGMTREQFDAAFPEEFWRQVVDRVAAEAPDTLLLAEAFWLMEGYFVRTLGMHRVYNSAFMNMLKMEDNAKYRTTVRNVLEFSPEVLKRFVNFMNNPDERTAIEQFGKGDKYFGVAMMMVTMPGLPMFGHGQIEGFTEKYGMEYRKAYWDEPVDEELVKRHEREIFPLMRRRRLFSHVEHFAFYDFHAPEGHVDENVFAYSNRADEQRALIVYNNAYPRTSGWIRRSVAVNVGRQDDSVLVHRELFEALSLSADPGVYYVFTDMREGLQYLREGRELAERGLFVQLQGYQYYAFLDWRMIRDQDGAWSELCARLGGRGVPDMARAHKEVVLDPVLSAFRRLFSAERIDGLADMLPDASWNTDELTALVRQPLLDLFFMARQSGLAVVDVSAVLPHVTNHLRCMAGWPEVVQNLRLKQAERELLLSRWNHPSEAVCARRFVVVWSIVHHLGRVFGPSEPGGRPSQWMHDWLLSPLLTQSFAEMGCEYAVAHAHVATLEAMLDHAHFPPDAPAEILREPNLREALGVNEYKNVRWFNQERYEEMLHWMVFGHAVETLSAASGKATERRTRVQTACERALRAGGAAAQAGYSVEKTLALIAKPPRSQRAARAKPRKPRAGA